MEKKAKMPGNRPNQSNGSVHRHGHMSSSAAASGVHGASGTFNLKQQDDHQNHEQSFRRSRSFCGRPFQTDPKAGETPSSSSKLKKNTTTMMKRHKTHPELLNRDDDRVSMNNTKMSTDPVEALSVNKLLVNVTVAQSTGPLRLLLSKDATVEDVIKGTLLLYAKEGRKPLLTHDSASFGLHYSQFSIDCLNPADKIKDLGSRRFFLCSMATAKERCRVSFQRGETAVTDRSSSSPSSCGKEVQKISIITEPWYSKLMQWILCESMPWTNSHPWESILYANSHPGNMGLTVHSNVGN